MEEPKVNKTAQKHASKFDQLKTTGHDLVSK